MAPAARREAVTWLAGHAVGLEYADAPQQYAPPPADGDAAQAGDADEGADVLSGGACCCASPGGATREAVGVASVPAALAMARRCDATPRPPVPP